MADSMLAGELSAMMSLSEALETAMSFELRAYQFYLELAARVESEVRPLVLELAAEEQDHHRILAEIAADPHLEEHLRARIATPPTAGRFQACVHLPALPEQPIEDDVLSYAEACEELAREHYGYLAEATPKGPLRDLFLFLHQEEQRHAERVSTRWSTLFSIL